MRAAYYAVDRYRPSDGYDGATEEEIDKLARQLAENAVQAARRAITEGAAGALHKRLTQKVEVAA